MVEPFGAIDLLSRAVVGAIASARGQMERLYRTVGGGAVGEAGDGYAEFHRGAVRIEARITEAEAKLQDLEKRRRDLQQDLEACPCVV